VGSRTNLDALEEKKNFLLQLQLLLPLLGSKP
jgi:hypothetical protein